MLLFDFIFMQYKPNTDLDQVPFALNFRPKLSRSCSVCSLNLLIWIDIM